MKFYSKVPLYLGLLVLIGSIITSAIVLGERKAVTYQQSRAAASSASLSLKFSTPNLVSVYLTSNTEIAGVDIAIQFNGQKVLLLPSSLTAGPSFITSGGRVDEEGSIFSFSALPNKNTVSSGIVATFNLQPKGTGNIEANLHFVRKNDNTAVWEKTTGSNILTSAE